MRAVRFSLRHYVCHLEVLRMLLASTADTLALDPSFRSRFPPFTVTKQSDSLSFALACGCRAIEVSSLSEVSPALSAVLPIICDYYSLSYRL